MYNYAVTVGVLAKPKVNGPETEGFSNYFFSNTTKING